MQVMYELRPAVLERDGHKCQKCGSGDHLNVHHIIPLSVGGNDLAENLTTLCRSCHIRAHKAMAEGFRNHRIKWNTTPTRTRTHAFKDSYKAIVQVIANGKFTIPREIRAYLDIKDGDFIEVDIIQLDIPEGEAEEGA